MGKKIEYWLHKMPNMQICPSKVILGKTCLLSLCLWDENFLTSLAWETTLFKMQTWGKWFSKEKKQKTKKQFNTAVCPC